MAPKSKLASLKKKVAAQDKGKLTAKSAASAAELDDYENEAEEVPLKRRRCQKIQEARIEGGLPDTSLLSGRSKNAPLASSIWGRDFDFNSIVDGSLLFPEAVSDLEKSDFNDIMSESVLSYLRSAAVIRFIQRRIGEISNDITAGDALKQRVKELEDSVSTLRAEKSSLHEAHKTAMMAKDEELQRISGKAAEAEREIAGLHSTKGRLERELKASEEKFSEIMSDVGRLEGQYDEAVAEGKEAVDEASEIIMSQVRHLAPGFDWSEVSAFKYFDEKSGRIRNVSSDDEDEDHDLTPDNAA